MKPAAAGLFFLLCSSIASGQNPDPSKWMCRDLSQSGGFLYEGETIFGKLACRPVPQVPPSPPTQATSSQSSTSTTPASATPLPAQQGVNTLEPPMQNTPAPTRQGLPRVFLQAASHGNTWNARRDQSMEMSKDFEKDCPGVRVTINQQVADYTVILNHIEVGLLARDNQLQVADKNGDLLQTKEGGGIKGGVKNVCALIHSDWAKQ
jgi:hypothetical protein